MPGFDLSTIIANIPALMIGFAFHEYAHAWMADRLGDPTPRSQGRLTLNPFAHLDVFGTLMALFFSFGWAKPVMTSPRHFRGNPRTARILVSIAGPLANLLVAFIAMLAWFITLKLLKDSAWVPVIYQVFRQLVLLNLALGVFNLLPIPPLDGFSVLSGILPARFYGHLVILESYGMIILFTNILGSVLWPLVIGLFNLYQKIIILVLSPFF